MSSKRVFIIEDEPDIVDVMVYNLRKKGFDVAYSNDGSQGYEEVRRQIPDLLILDLMLPGIDGLEVCVRLRSEPLTRGLPIIMVSAKSEESDVLVGLSIGADDYLPKPFSPRELVARVEAVLRRGTLRHAEDILIFPQARLQLDPERYEVRVDDRLLSLTLTEFRLLHVLASHPGRAFSRDQLLDEVMGVHAAVVDRNIDVHIGAIRRKLGEERRNMIETIRGVGYRFQDLEAANVRRQRFGEVS